MVEVFIPRDEGELAIAKSILESEDIKYYVKNDHFGSLYPGASISFFNEKKVYVEEQRAEEAKELLKILIDNKKPADS